MRVRVVLTNSPGLLIFDPVIGIHPNKFEDLTKHIFGTTEHVLTGNDQQLVSGEEVQNPHQLRMIMTA